MSKTLGDAKMPSLRDKINSIEVVAPIVKEVNKTKKITKRKK